jgi:hypothetical protein
LTADKAVIPPLHWRRAQTHLPGRDRLPRLIFTPARGAGLLARFAVRLKEQRMKGAERGRSAVAVRGQMQVAPGLIPF